MERTRKDKKRRILELQHLLLTGDGRDDEVLFAELASLVVHPEPGGLLLNFEEDSEDEFFALLDHRPTALLWPK